MLKYLLLLSIFALAIPISAQQSALSGEEQAACLALLETPNVTITHAALKSASGATPRYCYIQGTIAGRIRFHMQLPLRANWNGRLVNVGDSGKDGSLEYYDQRLAQGYAVANSNTGHDSGSEPRASFAYENPDAVIDFGYRAIHLTANASKAVVRSYYRTNATFSYFEGCSTGGRQGLMEAQRYPDDFDGIVSGAPVFDYQALNAGHVWMAQKVFADKFAGNLAFDKDGDGVQESLTKWQILRDAVWRLLVLEVAHRSLADGSFGPPAKVPFVPNLPPPIVVAEVACGLRSRKIHLRMQAQILHDPVAAGTSGSDQKKVWQHQMRIPRQRL